MKRYLLLVILLLPVLVLFALAADRIILLQTGEKVELPVSGYDPRDLVAGHYVTYRVEYGARKLCPSYPMQGCVCIKGAGARPGKGRFVEECRVEKLRDCRLYIRGECTNVNSFKADIERFYINEKRADRYDRAARSKKARIRVAVNESGRALVADFVAPGMRK